MFIVILQDMQPIKTMLYKFQNTLVVSQVFNEELLFG